MSKKKIKDTKLGSWLKDKAPNILSIAGDLLPDSGGLGIVKNLISQDDSIDPAEAEAKINAEIEFQKERYRALAG